MNAFLVKSADKQEVAVRKGGLRVKERVNGRVNGRVKERVKEGVIDLGQERVR